MGGRRLMPRQVLMPAKATAGVELLADGRIDAVAGDGDVGPHRGQGGTAAALLEGQCHAMGILGDAQAMMAEKDAPGAQLVPRGGQ